MHASMCDCIPHCMCMCAGWDPKSWTRASIITLQTRCFSVPPANDLSVAQHTAIENCTERQMKQTLFSSTTRARRHIPAPSPPPTPKPSPPHSSPNHHPRQPLATPPLAIPHPTWAHEMPNATECQARCQQTPTKRQHLRWLRSNERSEAMRENML